MRGASGRGNDGYPRDDISRTGECDLLIGYASASDVAEPRRGCLFSNLPRLGTAGLGKHRVDGEKE